MYDFGNTLKELRKSKKLTQKRLGDKLGVSEAMISKYESNLAFPQFETLRALSVTLNVSLDELCGVQPKGTVSLHGLTEEQINSINNLINSFKYDKALSRKSLSPEQCMVIGQIIAEFLK